MIELGSTAITYGVAVTALLGAALMSDRPFTLTAWAVIAATWVATIFIGDNFTYPLRVLAYACIDAAAMVIFSRLAFRYGLAWLAAMSLIHLAMIGLHLLTLLAPALPHMWVYNGLFILAMLTLLISSGGQIANALDNYIRRRAVVWSWSMPRSALDANSKKAEQEAQT